MSVSSTEHLDKLDAILFDRPAGRNIIGHAIETIKTLRRERDEAQAEAESLRLAAKAWEAYEDYQSTTSQSNTIRTITEKWPSMADVAQKARVFMAAAARVRAAKGGGA